MATSEHPTERENPTAARNVPAGPGDAGREDRPEPVPEASGMRPKGRQAVLLFAGLIIFGLVVFLLLAGAA